MDKSNNLRLVSLVNCCLDELHFPSREPILEMLGGPGAFGTPPHAPTFYVVQLKPFFFR